MSFEVEGYGNGLETTDIIECSFLPLIAKTRRGVTFFTSQRQIFRPHCRQRPHLLYLGLKCVEMCLLFI